MCSAAAGNSITSFTQATVNVIALASINVTPSAPQVAAGGTTQLTATGTYTDGSTQNLTPTATWVSSAPSVATVSAGLVSCSASATAGGSATISATGATATGTTTGSTTVTCLAPVLQSITIAPTQLTLPTGGTAQLAATGQLLFRTRAASDEHGPVEFQRLERRHGVIRRPRDLQRRRDHERLLDDHRHERQHQRIDRRDLPGAAAQVHHDRRHRGSVKFLPAASFS